MSDRDERLHLILCRFSSPDGPLEDGQRVTATANEHLPGVGQLDATLRPLKNHKSDLTFQIGDLLTECRLSNPQTLGSAREVQFFSEGDSRELQANLW
jgi:hypothetical protein